MVYMLQLSDRAVFFLGIFPAEHFDKPDTCIVRRAFGSVPSVS